MKQQRDSKQRIALVQRFAEGSAAPEEIQVVPTGKWDHPVYGEMEITSADIGQFVQNFKAKVRNDLPITAGHDNGMSGGELRAIGWFKELIDRGINGLWGAVEWTQEGKDLLAERAFKYFSPEFYEQYSDPETQAKYEHVLVGGALTNKPYFKELEPVLAFSEPDIMNQETTSTMNLKDILAKKPKELSEPEKAFLKEHKSELNADQMKVFEEAVGEEKAEEKAEEKTEEKAEEKGGEEKVEASEKAKVITMSEGEAKLLREKADQGAKAFAELERMRAEKVSDKLIFSEANKEGHFLPKQKDALTAFMFSLSQTQRDQFTTLVNGLPKTSLSFGEIGDGGKTDTNGVVAEVETAVKAKMAEMKLSYSDALKLVFKENGALARRYNAHVTGDEDSE